MASLPELEGIEVDTPPASPVLFTDDFFDTPCVEEFASPTKRARVNSRFEQLKRQKKDTVRNSQRVPDEVIQQFDVPDEVAQQFYDDNEDVPQVSGVPTDGYTAYVAAVSGLLAGFYPLSDELYVVQGWDNKSNHVKVSLALAHQQIRLTICRTRGITCSASRPGAMYTSLVFVLKVGMPRKYPASMSDTFKSTIR